MKIEKMELTVTRENGKWLVKGTIKDGRGVYDINLEAVEADLESINATDQWFIGSMLATVGKQIAGMNG